MFRRTVFALMLIGAAFAGGAAINGPGLAWLQRNFAAGRSIIVDNRSNRPPAAKSPIKPFPSTGLPPLQIDPRPAPPVPAKKAAVLAELARADAPLLPESPSTPASALAPLPPPTATEADPLASAPALASTDQPSKAGPVPVAPRPASLPVLDPVARLASIERPDTSASSPSAAGSKDWAGLRKRMKALGVARYTIEGETDGRVRFSCVIPVDGLKAVGHHFEAEGEDEYQAAEAALRRVTLWKATAQD
jgi:hypothetical protein